MFSLITGNCLISNLFSSWAFLSGLITALCSNGETKHMSFSLQSRPPIIMLSAIVAEGANITSATCSPLTRLSIFVLVSSIKPVAFLAKSYEPRPAFTARFLFTSSIA